MSVTMGAAQVAAGSDVLAGQANIFGAGIAQGISQAAALVPFESSVPVLPGLQIQAQTLAKRLDQNRWLTCAQMPIQLVVTVPLPAISLKELVALRTGQLMVSSWLTRDDVPLQAGEIFLANVSFEPAGFYLAVRISGFQAKSANATEATQQHARSSLVGAQSSDEDHTLNDIRLPASLCFGSKSMQVRQVLELTSGDAIVLERSINAHVSVLTGRRIVAQGELIAVKGCYGVKLTRLSEPSKRLRDAEAQI